MFIAILFGGGVLITDKSLAPNKENCNVLGIGVALLQLLTCQVLKMIPNYL